MANTNCLAGIKCPKCGSDEQFRIEAKAMFNVTDDGTEHASDGAVEWDDGNYCECYACSHYGTVKDFKVAESMEPAAEWGPENRHEEYLLEDWQYDVRNGDTKLGYHDWVLHNRPGTRLSSMTAAGTCGEKAGK